MLAPVPILRKPIPIGGAADRDGTVTGPGQAGTGLV